MPSSKKFEDKKTRPCDLNHVRASPEYVFIFICTGRFIMYSGITNVYYWKPIGHLFIVPTNARYIHFKTLKSHIKTLNNHSYMFRSRLKPSSGSL
jgi:hypothetical protein